MHQIFDFILWVGLLGIGLMVIAYVLQIGIFILALIVGAIACTISAIVNLIKNKNRS